MRFQKDYYDILGISPAASPEEVGSAFRQALAKLESSELSEEKVAELEEAYLVLSDSGLREDYNRFYRLLKGAGLFSDGLDWSKFEKREDREGDGEEGEGWPEEEILKNIWPALKKDFLAWWPEGDASWPLSWLDKKDKDDVEMDLTLKPEETGRIKEKLLAYDCFSPCPDCSGTGSERGRELVVCAVCLNRAAKIEGRACLVCAGLGKYPEKNCLRCKGAGRVLTRKLVEIKIPDKIKAGDILRVAGAGNRGFRGKKSGDLLVRVLLASSEQKSHE